MSMRPASFPFAAALALLASTALGQYEGALPVEGPFKTGFESIDPDYCKEVLTFLSGDECQGRKTGTPGYQKAADFMAGKFKEAGLKPVGDDGSYFQQVPFPREHVDVDRSFLEYGRTKLLAGKDVNFDSGSGDLTAELVVVSGKTEALLKEPKSLRKAIVILNVPDGRNSGVRRQINRDRPEAILYVVDQLGPPADSAQGRGGASKMVVGSISKEALARLLKAMAAPASTLEAPKDPKDAKAVTLKACHLSAVSENGSVNVPNVVGFLEGSDPKLKSEMVICGSHLDHLGMGADGKIFHGADDDGSGSTGIAALIRAYSKNASKPKRSLLFLMFCGEELGLKGSAFYAEHPIFPLDRAVCEVQLDMIGRDEENEHEKASENIKSLHPVGSKRLSTQLHELVLECNRHIGFDFEYDAEDLYTRSDHYNFAQKGVPIVFFTSGLHNDYHKVTDTVDKINFTKLANTAKLAYLISYLAADRPARLVKDK